MASRLWGMMKVRYQRNIQTPKHGLRHDRNQSAIPHRIAAAVSQFFQTPNAAHTFSASEVALTSWTRMTCAPRAAAASAAATLP